MRLLPPLLAALVLVPAAAADPGRVLWTFAAPEPVGQGPATDGRVVVEVGYDHAAGVVRALDAADGRPLWTARVAAVGGDVPVVAGGRVYVPASLGTGLVVLDELTGGLLWHHATPHAEAKEPGVAGGAVYVSDDRGSLVRLDAATGRVPFGLAEAALPFSAELLRDLIEERAGRTWPH
jgi:outer membrane protein assembly factor BamB